MTKICSVGVRWAGDTMAKIGKERGSGVRLSAVARCTVSLPQAFRLVPDYFLSWSCFFATWKQKNFKITLSRTLDKSFMSAPPNVSVSKTTFWTSFSRRIHVWYL